jgi:hypothetical protein
MRKQRFARRKFAELVLLICCRLDPERKGVDEALLFTALYRIDMEAYARTGRSITGSRYIKGPHYPIPVGT